MGLKVCWSWGSGFFFKIPIGRTVFNFSCKTSGFCAAGCSFRVKKWHFLGIFCLFAPKPLNQGSRSSAAKWIERPSQCFFFSPWHFFMGVTFDFWNLSRPFFRCHGHFFENCHGRFGNVTGKNVTGRCHGHFSTFWDLSRAFSKCHGHFFSPFFYHKVKFHKNIWLKEYRLWKTTS